MSCTTPDPGDLPEIVETLARWQPAGGSVTQVHPGDLGWFQRFGAERTAEAVRRWSRDGETMAIGLLDEPDYLRLAIAPAALADTGLGDEIAGDLAEVLVDGKVYADPPTGAAVRTSLSGWLADDPWIVLHRDLSEPVEAIQELDIERVDAGTAVERVAVQRAAFDGSTFTIERWHAMAAGAAYREAVCLLGRDRQGNPVAAITVWSAGPGRPGIIEPMGVDREARGNGYGRAITVAGAAALRDLGASGATVATPAFNTEAVATYESAGFVRQEETRALIRPE
jgi:ribosomal protein S18 acetylase RimI-like enzyme